MSIRSFITKFSVVLFLGLFLSACVNLGTTKNPDIQSYTLNYVQQSQAKTSAQTGKKVLMLGLGQAAPGFRSEKMVYQQGDYQLKHYALHRWVASPVSLITPIFSDALSASNVFKAVVNAPLFAGKVDVQVNVELLALEQIFHGNTSVERLALQVVIVDMRRNQLIATRRFETAVPAEPNPEAGVAAANQALAELIPQMVNFVVKNTQ